MPYQIIRNDITKMNVDVIVNSANPEPIIGGGVDFAIHEAGGKELVQARIELGRISTSMVKYTKGYLLPSKYVIHTVGPVWYDGTNNEENKLYACYEISLKQAFDMKCESIAFPLISTGAFKFPKEKALKIATKAIKDFLENYEMMIYLVVFDHNSFVISKEIHHDIESFIGTPVVSLQTSRERAMGIRHFSYQEISYDRIISESDDFELLDETWQEAMLSWMDKLQLTAPEVYKKANLTRQHFSKIQKDKYYHPSKPTAVAFCIAMELGLDETIDLLRKAGYELSLSIKFDIIIRYYIKKRCYDIYEINNVLFDFDQELLGATIL